MIKCIIIEDELPAIDLLKAFIKKVPQLNLLESFTNPLEAKDFLKQYETDLIFLDINLPVISGVDFIKVSDQLPPVILTTAYQEYALEGYELNVVDYLLKPFSFERFLKAIDKVSLHQKLSFEEKEPESLSFYADKQLIQLALKDILWIKSEREYVKVKTTDGEYLFLQSLTTLEEKLGATFSRCHKSYMINLNRIEKVVGNCVYVAKNEIPLGRVYKKNFMAAFNKQTLLLKK